MTLEVEMSSADPSRTRRSPTIKSAVVVGTGLMAPSIAAALAHAGVRVAIVGRRLARQETAARNARNMTPSAAKLIHVGSWQPATFDKTDLVCEAVVEDENVKAQVLARVESLTRRDALITTNTSSLRLTDLARALTRPERFAGLHFLNPAHLTAVVEVIPAPETTEGTITTLMELVATLGKEAIRIKRDLPGFAWNRIQMAILRECLHLLQEGVVDAKDIDLVISSGLAPRWISAGPLMTVDLGGTELFHTIAQFLFPTLSNDTNPQFRPDQMFYEWSPGDKSAVLAFRDKALRTARRLSDDRPWPSARST